MRKAENDSRKEEFLSRAQCTLLRGVAILCIVLHNYIHNLYGALEENEFRFHAIKVRSFRSMLEQFSAESWPQLFSFLGHYGVPVFIFLSGFGLVKKYERKEAPSLSFGRFIGYNYLKLLRLMLPVILLTILFRQLWAPDTVLSPRILIGQITMLGNIVPYLSPYIGPYWFFGAIMQLYAVYWLLLRKGGNRLLLAVMIICLIPAFIIPSHEYWMRYYHVNFPYQMLSFGLGILVARTRVTRYFAELSVAKSALCWILTLLFFVEIEIWRWTWPFAPVAIILAALFSLKPLWALKGLRGFLVWTGSISAFIFASHPLVRDFFMLFGSELSQQMVVLYLAVVLATGWIMSLAMRAVPSPKLRPSLK